jgi:hypothetical protein
MRRLLNNSLQRRCLNLQYRFRRKQRQRHASQLVQGPLSRDEEMGCVFVSCPPCDANSRTRWRESCAVERITKLPSCCPNPTWGNLPRPPIPPMDERFRDAIVPVLCKGWPSLKIVEIRGVEKAVLACLEKKRSSLSCP